jgi:hypothetical protein
MGLQTFIRLGGRNLAVNIALNGTLTKPIPDAAAEFGSDAIHIVGHSKGGLWTRAFLEDSLPSLSKPLRIISVTTVDTPHPGSINADDRVLIHDLSYDSSHLFNPREIAIEHNAPWGDFIRDLATWDVQYFNATNTLPRTSTVKWHHYTDRIQLYGRGRQFQPGL